MTDFDKARRQMVERQIERRGVHDPRVLAAMREVPRERFVEPADEAHAYEDQPLAIPEGQTISQPYIVARMAEAARLQPQDKVLEVGTGSGYAAAVLGRLARDVHTVERHASLAREAARRLAALGYGNIRVHTGDGTKGLPNEAPFDAILVTAGAPEIPPALKTQLAIGGRLVIPVGDRRDQRLVRILRTGPDDYEEEDLGGVRFVPLVGELGWGGEAGT